MRIAIIICIFFPVLAESRSTTKTYLRREYVTNLYLFLFSEKRFVHTIQFRTQAQTCRIIGNPIETIQCITRQCFQFMFCLIVMLVNLTSIPTLCIIDRRRNLQIFEQCKSSTDRNIVIHCILPFT